MTCITRSDRLLDPLDNGKVASVFGRTLLLNGALRGFFAIAMIAPDFLTVTRGCASNTGREVEKAPFEESLLVCMLERTVIDIDIVASAC